jgi:hypothetical protein
LEIREFLNLPNYNSIAAIYVSVDEDGYPTWKIADCSNIVSLDLGPGEDAEGWACTMHKLDLIIRATQTLRTVLAKSARKDGWVDPKRSKHV